MNLKSISFLVYPGKEPEAGARKKGGLSRNTIIGIAAGCGGFLLIVLVAIALSCILKKKDKNQMYNTHASKYIVKLLPYSERIAQM